MAFELARARPRPGGPVSRGAVRRGHHRL